MANTDDMELLRRFGIESSDAAFENLVQRYIQLVYSSALRQCRDPHVAEDVTQNVFILLARKAVSLKAGTHLGGWLYRTTRFIASEAMRSERRRRDREHAAMDPSNTPQESSPWDEIAPALDDAMAELGDTDRSLLLLRFFENKSLKETGGVLGFSENAAQKRISRALDRLRLALQRRGATVSPTALAGLLAGFATQSAPSGLTAATLAAVTAPATLLTAALITESLPLIAMTKIKIATAAGLALAVLSTPFVLQQSALNAAREENRILLARLQQLESPVPERIGPSIDEAELERLRRLADEVHGLRGRVGFLQAENRRLTAGGHDRSPSSPAIELAPADANNPSARLDLGRKLAAQGRYAEALEHFLWCFDEGVKHSPGFAGVRLSFLLGDLQRLGRDHPPAGEALLARRQSAEERMRTGAFDPYLAYEMIQLNETTGMRDRTLQLFDGFPPRHPARRALVEASTEQLIAAQRYQDIVEESNPEALFDRGRMLFTAAGQTDSDEERQSILRRKAVETGAMAMEALAGAGEVERADALAAKILQFDGSPEARGVLRRHATRANNPDLASRIDNRE